MNKTPQEILIQTQFDAYNARDIVKLMDTYAEDAVQFEFPDKILATGSAQIRERFLTRFAEPNLHATIHHRIVVGDMVIDHETVRRTFPEGTGTIELAAMYQVQKGKIAKAWFVTGRKTLD